MQKEIKIKIKIMFAIVYRKNFKTDTNFGLCPVRICVQLEIIDDITTQKHGSSLALAARVRV